MHLKKLILKNFRNYSDISVQFSITNNLLIGENGQGKTNILEAIYLLGMMKSFRPVSDKDIIKQNGDSYFIKGIFEDGMEESAISIGVHKKKKQVKQNETVVQKISSLVGNAKMVVFTHSDIDLIIGSPSIRRKYLDIALSLASKPYFKLLQNYHKVLKQRNKALKGGREPDIELITIWDNQLIEFGSEVIAIRKAFFDPINEMTKELYHQLNFDMTDFHLIYHSSLGKCTESNSIADLFQKKLVENRDREIQYKQTLFGPHKDDFSIRNGRVDFKRFASQGQCRAGALTLKLAMTKYVEQISQNKAMLLLDDVLLDLDEQKKNAFLELVDGRQNFFTATSMHGLAKINDEDSHHFIVSNESLYLS